MLTQGGWCHTVSYYLVVIPFQYFLFFHHEISETNEFEQWRREFLRTCLSWYYFPDLLLLLYLIYDDLLLYQIATSRRLMLERFEQSCAVDNLTKKCAGPTDNCRRAMLGILGTELRITCACKGTDYVQLYECLGWQRLLWLNPCVGKFCGSFIGLLTLLFRPEGEP